MIPKWNAVSGVWEGGLPCNTEEKFENPLYIFGYGSLIWRPGDLLKEFPSYGCKCIGWQRRYKLYTPYHIYIYI